MSYEIIRWQENIDIRLIDKFICEIQKSEFNLQEPEKFNFCIRDMRKYYKGPNNRVNFFVAVSNHNSIVGCIGLKDLGQDGAELRKFYVHSNYRKLSLGRYLFDEAMKAAKDSGFKKIYTGTMNIKFKAQEFYKRNGFKEINRTLLPSSFQPQKLDEKFYVQSTV